MRTVQPRDPNPKDKTLAKIKKASERINELRKIPQTKEILDKKDRIFAGHWRFFKVRADVLRSSQGETLSKVVEATNKWVLGQKKDPESYRSISWIGQNGGKGIYSNEQSLQPLSFEELQEKGLNSEKYLKWFSKEIQTQNVGSKILEKPVFFPKLPKHTLEFDYKKAYVVEITHPNPDVESEMARLYQFMTENKGWEKLHGKGKDYSFDLERKNKLTKSRKLNKKIIEDQLM